MLAVQRAAATCGSLNTATQIKQAIQSSAAEYIEQALAMVNLSKKPHS
jgi:predicted O-linked N-acetylglucosamine transferase (SPINDLY family)